MNAQDGGFFWAAKPQGAETLFLILPWALPPTAARVLTGILSLPQGDAGAALASPSP